MQMLELMRESWSGREDLNLRLPAPEAGALPGCATPRQPFYTKKIMVESQGETRSPKIYRCRMEWSLPATLARGITILRNW